MTGGLKVDAFIAKRIYYTKMVKFTSEGTSRRDALMVVFYRWRLRMTIIKLARLHAGFPPLNDLKDDHAKSA